MDDNVHNPEETVDKFEIKSTQSKTKSLNKIASYNIITSINLIEETIEPKLLEKSISKEDQSEFKKLSKSFDTNVPSTKVDVSENGLDSFVDLPADIYHDIQIKEEDSNRGFSSTSSLIKSVSFVEDNKDYSNGISKVSKTISNRSYQTPTSSLAPAASTSNTLQSETRMKKSLSILQNIPEVDENGVDETPGYYGWDGYEARFERSLQEKDSSDSIPKCIPPWAKSVRRTYGLPFLESVDTLEESNLQERIENFMKKHKEVMLLKRVESKKQVVVEPNKDPSELDTVKLRAKSTRYYMTPLTTLGKARPSVENYDDEDKIKYNKLSLHDVSDSENMSITKKTSRPQAKREISSVLKSFAKKSSKKLDEIKEHEKLKKSQNKCPKITLSKLREFVNMDAEDKKLHEIIKIEKVPSTQNLKLKESPASKYIINVPHHKTTDKATLNVIKIKEKRKLRVGSIENLEEKVTEVCYNEGATQKHKRESDYSYTTNFKMEPDHLIKKKVKSPTETKTFQVTTKETPVLSPLVCEKAKESDKVLLIQYDKRSKSSKLKDGKIPTHKSQIVGIKETSTDSTGEIYFYDSESYGKQTRENFTKEDKVPTSLKDKVHLIFEELRDLTLKPGATLEASSTSQVPSHVQVKTETAKVQAMPETRSAEVQVTNSQLFKASEDDSQMLMVPHPSPASMFNFGLREIQTSLDNEKLNHKLHLVPSRDILRENIPDDLAQKGTDGKVIEQEIKDVESQKLLINDEEITIAKTQTKDEIITDQQTSVEEQKLGELTDSYKVIEAAHVYGEENMRKETNEIENLSYSETQPTSEKEIQETLIRDLQTKELTSAEVVKTDDQISKTTTEISQDQLKEPFSEESNTHTTERKLQQTSSKASSKTLSETLKQSASIGSIKPSSLGSIIGSLKPASIGSVKPASIGSVKPASIGSVKPTSLGFVKPDSIVDKKTIASKVGPIEQSSSLSQKNKTFHSMSEDKQDTCLIKGLDQHEGDITSYDLQPEQFQTLYNKDTKSSSFESVITKASSKFLHPKAALRKMVNWTDDTIYLENNTCPSLIRGLAETALRQPNDPVAFLAHWIYKDYENRESREREEVKQEHLMLAKTMEEVSGKQTHSKFNVRKYPMEKKLADKEKLKDMEDLENETRSQEVVQEA